MAPKASWREIALQKVPMVSYVPGRFCTLMPCRSSAPLEEQLESSNAFACSTVLSIAPNDGAEVRGEEWAVMIEGNLPDLWNEDD